MTVEKLTEDERRELSRAVPAYAERAKALRIIDRDAAALARVRAGLQAIANQTVWNAVESAKFLLEALAGAGAGAGAPEQPKSGPDVGQVWAAMGELTSYLIDGKHMVDVDDVRRVFEQSGAGAPEVTRAQIEDALQRGARDVQALRTGAPEVDAYRESVWAERFAVMARDRDAAVLALARVRRGVQDVAERDDCPHSINYALSEVFELAGAGAPEATQLPATAREHARRRGALDGADAQALEGALSLTERERNTALARVAELEAADVIDGDVYDAVRADLAAANARIAQLEGEVFARSREQAQLIVERDAAVEAANHYRAENLGHMAKLERAAEDAQAANARAEAAERDRDGWKRATLQASTNPALQLAFQRAESERDEWRGKAEAAEQKAHERHCAWVTANGYVDEWRAKCEAAEQHLDQVLRVNDRAESEAASLRSQLIVRANEAEDALAEAASLRAEVAAAHDANAVIAADNGKLRAEVEGLKLRLENADDQETETQENNAELQSERDDLRAEVKRLQADTSEIDRVRGANIRLRAEVERLLADEEASKDFAAETGIVIGDLKQQLTLAKQVGGGFSSALLGTEARLAAATELLQRTHRENIRWSGTGTTRLARDIDAFLANAPAAKDTDNGL